MKIKEIIEKYGIRPSKRLGQNFLTNKGIVDKIIKTADIKPEEVILEIGPGLGVLTRELAKYAKQVITVEKDSKLASLLKEELKEFKNVEIINADILKFDLLSFPFSSLSFPRKRESRLIQEGLNPRLRGDDNRYRVVANLPFNIATAIIQKFLEAKNRPSEMILMVQKEVAQRICAKPPQMSILAVSVQLYSDPKILFYVSKGSFYPSPKVDAAFLKITRKKVGEASPLPKDHLWFFEIVRAGFSHPRKQLASNLSKELGIDKKEVESWLVKNDINPTRRAETLTVQDWLKLSTALLLTDNYNNIK